MLNSSTRLRRCTSTALMRSMISGLFGISAAVLAVALPSGAAQAQTLVENTVANNVTNIFPGQSVTTPTGGPFNNITFNWFAGVSGGVAFQPIGQGTLFILTQEYLGTPAALSPSTPGYVASVAGSSGGAVYTFPSSLQLQGGTQYFFYSNILQSFAFSRSNPYAGGESHIAVSAASPYTPDPDFDVAFRLNGTPVASEAPEPGSLALIAIFALPMVGMVIRRRKSA